MAFSAELTTTDAYTSANTLDCPGAERINFEIRDNAIYYQLAYRAHGAHGRAAPFSPEVRAGRTLRSLDRKVERVRVRSAAAGAPAVVIVEAMTKAELP